MTDDIVFSSHSVRPHKTDAATSKQKRYAANLLKANPSLDPPTDWSRNGLRQWIDRAREAVGPEEGHPSPLTGSHYYDLPNLYHEIVGHPNSLIDDLL